MSHIFISYSKKNRDYARPLADHLLSLGFDVWIDDEIQPSEDWWRNIRMAIKDCAAFILLMTPEAENSHWVGLELLHGLEYKKPLFPLLLAGSPNLLESDSWSRIASIQFTDVRNRSFPPERFYDGLTRRGVPRKPLPGKDITPPALPSVDSGDAASETTKSTTHIPAVVKDTSDSPPSVRGRAGGGVNINIPALTAAILSILPPPFDWCPIPAGKVTIEYSNTDHQTFDVPAFLMAKYPITNAQYQAFVDAKDGYRDPRWWDYSDHAQSWCKDNPKPEAAAYPGDDLPRTNVSWYESVAFCRWLTAHLLPTFPRGGKGSDGWNTGEDQTLAIILTTEQQWQRTAQGDDNYIYPWGDKFDPIYCNTVESRLGQPTPVTQYSSGANSFGVFDLSGNVWEWCLTTWDGDSTGLGGDSYRVLRGGSWANGRVDARAASRDFDYPDDRNFNIGFRIVCRPPSP